MIPLSDLNQNASMNGDKTEEKRDPKSVDTCKQMAQNQCIHIEKKRMPKGPKSFRLKSISLKRLQKMKRMDKKLENIKHERSKELQHILRNIEIERDVHKDSLQNELSQKLFELRTNSKDKADEIVQQKKESNKVLKHRIIKKLEKLKTRIEKLKTMNNSNDKEQKLKQIRDEMANLFNERMDDIQFTSSRRWTRKKAIDFNKYKFALSSNQITKDLTYLLAKERENGIGASYVSLGSTSNPSGFLNDYNFVQSQLSLNRIRSKTRSRKQINYNEDYEELQEQKGPTQIGQKCVFEEGDDDEDYVMNDDDDGIIDSDQQIENAVWIDQCRLSKGDRIRIKENGCEKHGVIEQIMKFQIKVYIRTENGKKLKRIKYKDINNGLVNIVLRE